MLRNVLEDYLSSIKERDFDYPLIVLLHAMGFYDIHLTDGGSEIGKDFIAKRIEEGITYQYVIQSKRGDINQTKFREKILGQLMEAVVLRNLAHPQLDLTLPQRTVLVLTGELIDNAFLELRELNNLLENQYKKERVESWDKNRLIEFSIEYGLTGVHQTTVKGLTGFAQFYLNYSKAIEGALSDREIEEFSRFWLDGSLEYRKRILRATIEADIIATKLIEGGFIYEAITAYLGLVRMVLQVTYQKDDAFILEIYKEILEEKLLPLSRQFFTQFKSQWEAEEKSLLHLCLKQSPFPMLHYLVWCARVLEAISLYFFLLNDKAGEEYRIEQREAISFMLDFIGQEEGCGHIPSDRYSVSMVWATLSLIQSGNTDQAISLVKRCVIWLCDRIEKGFGIARYEVDEYAETATLVGYPFEFIKVEQNISSLLATILCDLAAFSGDQTFYGDVFNDLEACEVVYNYWQFPDTEGIFTIDTEDCCTYPNVPYRESIGTFEDYDYAEHIKNEPQSFQVTQKAGMNSLILLSILLKDRYFPKTWRQIISQNASAGSHQKPKKAPLKQRAV